MLSTQLYLSSTEYFDHAAAEIGAKYGWFDEECWELLHPNTEDVPRLQLNRDWQVRLKR